MLSDVDFVAKCITRNDILYNKTIEDYWVICLYGVDIHHRIPILTEATSATASVNIGILWWYHVVANCSLGRY